MQKVYLLLRSNQQTGPFSLEEIIQFDLKPYDLIWIEGRSAGWYYPQEIPALQPYLSFLKTAPAASTPVPVQASGEKPSQPAGPKKIFVSMPSNAIKEEPTPKPSSFSQPSWQPETSAPPSSFTPLEKERPETLKTSYAKSLEEVETDYMNWSYQKKAKKKTPVSRKGILVACLMVGVAFASWQMLQTPDEKPVETQPEQTAFLPAKNELITDSSQEEESTQVTVKSANNKRQKQDKKAIALAAQKTTNTKQDLPATQKDEDVVMNGQPNNAQPAPVVKEENKTAAEEKNADPVGAETPKEKKKLRDKIADIFRKKPEERKEEARPAEEEGGERRSVRREAGSNLAQMVTVKFSIPNDWMMGIKGAKATLTNRSSEAIVKAVVEVVYYNDDNDVLDKRTITFGNIKSKSGQTLAVPDHQTATRLEYNVVSVTGANEPFARM